MPNMLQKVVAFNLHKRKSPFAGAVESGESGESGFILFVVVQQVLHNVFWILPNKQALQIES